MHTLGCRVRNPSNVAPERVSRIVVTDAEGRPQGVISLSDVAMADAPHAAAILRQVASRELLGDEGTRQAPSPGP